jgi:ABC-type dipeptide/oligopeptide/nickel transport system permease subunit
MALWVVLIITVLVLLAGVAYAMLAGTDGDEQDRLV